MISYLCFIVTYGLIPLQDLRFQNLSDLNFDVTRSLKVKYNSAIRHGLHGLLLIYTVTTSLSLTF